MISRKLFVAIVILVIAFVIVMLFAGCYSQQKAQTQFSKAAIAYPIIPAQYCAITYPPKDSLIKGDSIVTTDTLYMSDGVTTDTLVTLDTVYLTKTEYKTKVVTNTIHITDTIQVESTAKLKECQIALSTTVDLLKNQTTKTDKYEGKAKTRGYIMWALILLLISIVGLNIYLRAKKTTI